MLIISFDWQEKIGNSRRQTYENIFISRKSPTEDMVQKNSFLVLYICAVTMPL